MYHLRPPAVGHKAQPNIKGATDMPLSAKFNEPAHADWYATNRLIRDLIGGLGSIGSDGATELTTLHIEQIAQDAAVTTERVRLVYAVICSPSENAYAASVLQRRFFFGLPPIETTAA